MISREERLLKLRALRANDFSEPEPPKKKSSPDAPPSPATGVASDKAASLIAEALKSLLRS
jgi:hypothetical protein